MHIPKWEYHNIKNHDKIKTDVFDRAVCNEYPRFQHTVRSNIIFLVIFDS